MNQLKRADPIRCTNCMDVLKSNISKLSIISAWSHFRMFQAEFLKFQYLVFTLESRNKFHFFNFFVRSLTGTVNIRVIFRVIAWS